MDYIKFPKIELHRHLEGSQRRETVIELTKKFNLDVKQFEVLEPMKDLKEVLDVFWTVQRLFKTPEIIERLTFEICEDAYFDGIKLLELRYSPSFMVYGHGIDFQTAHDSVLKGIAKARQKYDVHVGLIGIISRNLKTIADSNATIDLMIKNKDSFLALDFADQEVFDTIPNMKIFTDRIKKAGFNLTVHTGEETDFKHIQETIKHLEPNRIGHGIKVEFDENTIELIKSKNIHLEMCPISNFRTKCIPNLSAHPIARMHDKGISVSINSDDPGIFGSKLSDEYKICHEILGMNKEKILQINLNALKASFVDDDIKKQVLKHFV